MTDFLPPLEAQARALAEKLFDHDSDACLTSRGCECGADGRRYSATPLLLSSLQDAEARGRQHGLKEAIAIAQRFRVEYEHAPLTTDVLHKGIGATAIESALRARATETGETK